MIFLMGSVAGPLIHANGRLSFEDDLKSEGLIYRVSLCGHSGRTQGWLGVRERAICAVGYIQQLKALLASGSGIHWRICTV